MNFSLLEGVSVMGGHKIFVAGIGRSRNFIDVDFSKFGTPQENHGIASLCALGRFTMSTRIFPDQGDSDFFIHRVPGLGYYSTPVQRDTEEKKKG